MQDRGLQPERTGLAWSRTGLLALLTAALSIRIGMSAANAAHLLVALLLAALACTMLHHGYERSRYVDCDRAATKASRRLFFATSAVIVIASTIHASLILIRLVK